MLSRLCMCETILLQPMFAACGFPYRALFCNHQLAGACERHLLCAVGHITGRRGNVAALRAATRSLPEQQVLHAGICWRCVKGQSHCFRFGGSSLVSGDTDPKCSNPSGDSTGLLHPSIVPCQATCSAARGRLVELHSAALAFI